MAEATGDEAADQALVDRLTKSGWEEATARSVIDFNSDWFRLLRNEAPERLDEQMTRLAKLGEVGGLSVFLQDHPQYAALFTLLPDPAELTPLLGGPHGELIAGLFASHIDPDDMRELAAALAHDGELIARLLGRGLFGAELLFMFPRTHAADQEYRRWLERELSARLAGPEEGLASFVHLTLRSGDGIRRRMRADQGFRNDFPRLWGRLVQAAGQHGLEFYLDEPAVWPLLARSDGADLLGRCGLLAVHLLFGERSYPASLRDTVAALLLEGDGESVEALARLRGEPAFHHLLARPLPAPVLRAVLAKLNQHGSEAAALLARYRAWEDSTFSKEFAPREPGLLEWLPLYSVYVLAEKLYDGRETTAGDWIEAAVDVGTTFLPMPGSKATGALSVQLGRTGGEAAKDALMLAGKELARQTLRAGVKVSKQLAKKELTREALRWGVSQVLRETRRRFRTLLAALDRATTAEITSAVRFVFGYTGRRSMKLLTRLEARLFMRADGRVCLHLGRLAANWAKGPAKKALDYFRERLTQALGGAEASAARADPAKQQLSAWWLVSGALS